MSSKNSTEDPAANSITSEEHHIAQVEKKFVYKWVIHNFSCKKSRKHNLPSTVFTFNCGSSIIATNGTLSISGTCQDRSCVFKVTSGLGNFAIDVKLWAEEDGEANCAVSILEDQQKTLSKALHKNSIHNCSLLPTCLLCIGQCTIICEITFFDYVKNKIPAVNLQEPKLNPDSELFENKKHWDVTFVVLQQELHAHKCILASRNEVFAGIFEHGMEENKSNRVDIADVDLEVFEDMLRYIYTGKALLLKKSASKLLAASEKYNVHSLKSLSVNELANNIKIENAAETLILADLYKAPELKSVAIGFINTKRLEVANTEGWKSILTNNTHLLAELYLKT